MTDTPDTISEMIEIGEGTQHYVSSRKSRTPEEKAIQPPLTPMIDVTFQLLLYFLLTSTFRQDEGQIPGSLPQSGGASAEKVPFQPVRIVIAPEGPGREHARFTVDNYPPTADANEFYAYLEKRASQGSKDEIPVLIQSNGFVRWKYVVEAFNQAVRAKFKKIGFAPAS